MSRRQRLTDRVLSEVALYGGFPMRRVDILALAMEDLGEHAHGKFGADYFAFNGPAVDAEPWSIAEVKAAVRSIEAGLS